MLKIKHIQRGIIISERSWKKKSEVRIIKPTDKMIKNMIEQETDTVHYSDKWDNKY